MANKPAEKAKTFSCFVCNKSILVTEKKRHIQWHKESLKPYTCTPCKKSFRSRYELDKHRDIKHELKKLNCDHCNKTYSSQSGLNYHVLKVHKEPSINTMDLDFSVNSKSFSCVTCGIVICGRVALDDHNRCQHDFKKLECNTCSATFTRRSNFLRHKKKNCCKKPSGKPFFCSKCQPNVRFKLCQDLERHKKSLHTSAVWNCVHCEEPFSTSWSRYYHVKKYHSTK